MALAASAWVCVSIRQSVVLAAVILVFGMFSTSMAVFTGGTRTRLKLDAI
jgi:hypothetical protein